MSVISNREKAIDQLLHKDNICGENYLNGKVIQKSSAIEVTVGRHDADRTKIMKTPDDIKVLAGALFMVEGARVASEVSGLSKHLTRTHGKGLTTRTKYDEDLADRVLETKENIAAPIREKALNVLLNAIETITPEKLENAKLREAAGVARDMASVVEKLGDKANSGNSISFHFHAPRERKEDEYVTKDV